MPNQTPGLLERVGLTRQQVNEAAWAITRSGRRYRGAAAINRTLRELDRLRLLAALYRDPVIRRIEDRFYRWFAGNRGRFARWGVTPECERVPCTPEGD